MDLDVHLPAIQAGDDLSFASWVAGAEPSLRRGLSRYAAQVDVEVIVQESLLRAWQCAPRVVPDGRANALLRYAQRAANNLALDELRKRAAHRHHDAAEPLEDHVEPVEPDPLLRHRIELCRDALPGRAREALDARITGHGESDLAIATRLGMRLNTFLKTFGRAREMLAHCLERAGVRLGRIPEAP